MLCGLSCTSFGTTIYRSQRSQRELLELNFSKNEGRIVWCTSLFFLPQFKTITITIPTKVQLTLSLVCLNSSAYQWLLNDIWLKELLYYETPTQSSLWLHGDLYLDL